MKKDLNSSAKTFLVISKALEEENISEAERNVLEAIKEKANKNIDDAVWQIQQNAIKSLTQK